MNISGLLLRWRTIGKVRAMAQADVHSRLRNRPAVHCRSTRSAMRTKVSQGVLGVVLLLADFATFLLLSAA